MAESKGDLREGDSDNEEIDKLSCRTYKVRNPQFSDLLRHFIPAISPFSIFNTKLLCVKQFILKPINSL